MPLIPFASFLAGSILSLVLPVALLISITVWFHMSQKRIPEAHRTPRGSTPENPPPGNPVPGNPGPASPGAASAGTASSGPASPGAANPGPAQEPSPGGGAGPQSPPGGP